MLSADQIGQLTQQILAAVPEGSRELKRHLHTAMLNQFEQLELVTREEFEIQTRLLQRSREKLDVMEKRIAELEQHILK
ncbi:MAG: accessory factor UbiK family protein [Gammaproteobacteria bacterium]|nr:accessory factor UbiK family protein [Gammaproteobacteria bacterium]